MHKKKRVLVVALSLLCSINLFSCHREQISTSSSEVSSYIPISIITPSEALNAGGEAIYKEYQKLNNTYFYENFDLPKEIYVLNESARITISWELKVNSGDNNAVSIKDKNDHYEVYIGYFDNVCKEETTFELIPSLDYKGTSKTYKEIKGGTGSFIGKVKKLVINSQEEVYSKCKAAGTSVKTSIDTMCAVKGYLSSISVNKKYGFVTSDNEEYLLDISNFESRTFKIGDEIIATGQGYMDNGKYTIYHPNIVILNNSSPYYQMPAYKDISVDFKGVSSLSDNSLDKYQNMRVSVSNAILLDNEDNVYRFKFEDKNLVYKVILDTNLFLTQSDKEMVYNDFVTGMKATIGGRLIFINNEYVIVSDNYDSITITNSDSEKVNYVKENLHVNMLEVYSRDDIIMFPGNGQFGSTIEWECQVSEELKSLFDFAYNQLNLHISTFEGSGEYEATMKGTIKIGNAQAEILIVVKVRV